MHAHFGDKYLHELIKILTEANYCTHTHIIIHPLSKSHVVVTVNNATRTPICENGGGIDLATYIEARGVSIP